jgi:hypothetical protein
MRFLLLTLIIVITLRDLPGNDLTAPYGVAGIRNNCRA